MKAEPAPDLVEMIEMIEDNGDPFGDRRVGPPNDIPAAGPRWTGPVAAVVLLALVGYGVVSSTIDSPHKSSTKPPIAAHVVEPQFYVADPPSPFQMYFAEQRGDGATHAADFADSGPAQLWATDGASATNGSWFLVSLGHRHATGANSYRTVVDQTEVTIEHDPATGQARLSFTKGGQAFEITALGWLDRQLVRLVRSVSLKGSQIQFSDDFFATDHKRVMFADPSVALSGVPVARVGYATGLPLGLAQSFTITVSGDNVGDRDNVVRFALSDVATFSIGNATAIVGQSVLDPRVSVAQWRTDGRLITLQGNVDSSPMQGIAESVHKSTEDEVHRSLDTTFTAPLPGLQSPPSTIVAGSLPDGTNWYIKVSPRNPNDEGAGYVWWIGQPGDPGPPSETRASLPGGAPTIETYVEHGRTYVLAKVPRAVTGAELHVDPNGLPSDVSPMLDVDPAMGDQFTATVFFEPVPFTAEIVDGNGRTVASWPHL